MTTIENFMGDLEAVINDVTDVEMLIQVRSMIDVRINELDSQAEANEDDGAA